MRALVAAVLVVCASVAWAEEAPPPPVKYVVAVGESTTLSLGGVASVGQCDDPSLLRIEAAGTDLKIVGVKVGKTACGFWTQNAPGRITHIEVEVTAPSAKH
jgi:hypothetical protein